MKRISVVIVTLLVICLTIGNLLNVQLAFAKANTSPLAADMDAKFAVDWIQLFYDRIKADAVDAPGASRLYAYAGVTVYQAVVAGLPGDVPLNTQIKGMPALPPPESGAEYDWPTVANGALLTVASGLLTSDDSHKAAQTLADQQLTTRRSSIDKAVIDRSMAYGQTLGAAIVAWAAQDGAAEAYAKAKTYQLPTGNQWDYVITTPGTKPVGPYWGTLRPFALEQAKICDIPLNVDLSSDPQSTLYKQAMEVKTTGDHLTDEQKAIANWWVDTPGQTGAPAGHWMIIANQMVGDLHLTLGRAAEMYAMVGMVLGDSFIACWGLKYEHPYLRPVTYINRYIAPNWKPFIVTPPFPTYVSGHSVASIAAADVLTYLFGTVAFTDTTHVKEGQTARSFTSFEAAANEAAISRLYGGIHFRMDIENGLTQGRCVAQHVIQNIHLKA